MTIKEHLILNQKVFCLIVDEWKEEYKQFNKLFSKYSYIYPAIMVLNKENYNRFFEKE